MNNTPTNDLHSLIIELKQTAYRLNGTNAAYLMTDAAKALEERQQPADNTFIPKNLDRALTVLGVSLPVSKEEFNFEIERWIQRLIDRVIRCDSELNTQLLNDVERTELQKYRTAAGEPVAWDYEWASYITCEGPQDFKRVIEREAPPEWAIDEGQARNMIPLYRHAQVIPDGYALVPIEPTEDMIIHGFESEPDEHFSEPGEWAKYDAMSGCQQAAHRAKLCWAAMLAVAPKVGE